MAEYREALLSLASGKHDMLNSFETRARRAYTPRFW
jgi:hypothetical protein